MKLLYYTRLRMNNTEYAAHLMIDTGKSYTAAQLGKEMSITALKASGLLYNIRTSGKYEIETTALPNRTVKVLDVGNRNVEAALWRLAIFGIPL